MNRVPVELRYLAESKKPRRKRSMGNFGASLSPREREVFTLYLDGLRPKEIGARLGGISVKTVSTHKAVIMRKLGAKHDVDLVKIAIRGGYTSLQDKSRVG